jgi:hypothetical protein
MQPLPVAQPQSCRQLLQQRLQKYRWSATFHAAADGPQHGQKWRGAFRIRDVVIGVSGWEYSKNGAKEAAARSALGWLNQYGYH